MKKKGKWQNEFAQKMLTARPTAPSPNTATDESFGGFATLRVAPRPDKIPKNLIHQCTIKALEEVKSGLYFYLFILKFCTCGDPTTKNTDFVKRSQGVDLGKTANVNNSVLTKG